MVTWLTARQHGRGLERATQRRLRAGVNCFTGIPLQTLVSVWNVEFYFVLGGWGGSFCLISSWVTRSPFPPPSYYVLRWLHNTAKKRESTPESSLKRSLHHCVCLGVRSTLLSNADPLHGVLGLELFPDRKNLFTETYPLYSATFLTVKK